MNGVMKSLLIFIVGLVCGAAATSLWFVWSTPSSMFHADQQGPPLRTAPARRSTPQPVVSAPGASAAVSEATLAVPTTVRPRAHPESTDASLQALAKPSSSALEGLLIPVAGVQAAQLEDTFDQARSAGRTHDAIDIMAPRGTAVVAANDGRVVKLFTSVRGGLTVYQFDSRNRVVYYYAHLDRYAPGLAAGQLLQRGDPVGFVGSTGDASAEAPHLHFEIGVLGPRKLWWHSTPANPYGRFAGQHGSDDMTHKVP